LSDRDKENMREAKFWKAYDLKAFGARSESGEDHGAEFVSLQSGGDEEAVFIPLARGEGGLGRGMEAANIVKNAHEQAVRIEQEAYEKGFNQGEKDGLALGEKKALKVIEHIEELARGMTRLRKELVKQYEKDIVELIFAIAKRIIRQAVQTNEETVKGVLFEAAELAAEKTELTIRINPEDFNFVEQLRPEFFARFSELKSMTVTSDPSITRGGCLFETPYGEVDARIETQLERIYQSLEGVYKETSKVS
jgi:flagellar assembly protein FliH